MNCECIYYSAGATVENYAALAEKIEEIGAFCELYPCAISRMDKDCKCWSEYDAWGKSKNIPAASAVLFVGGKLHYMTDFRVGRRVYKPWFPADVPAFTDLQEF